MKEHEQESLDKLIVRAVNGRPVKLDFEAWRRRHRAQIDLFHRQRANAASGLRRGTLARRLVAAAVLLVAAGVSVMPFWPRSAPPVQWAIAPPQTPGEMMSLLHLNAAFRAGGLQAVEAQYEQAYTRLGPRPDLELDLDDLLDNGS